MHKGLLLSAACLFAASIATNSQAADVPLEVRLYCYDILVYPGKVDFGSIEDEVRVSSKGKFNAPNDELGFAPPEIPSTHWGAFHYTDGITFEGVAFDFEMNIPGRDANQNGIYDLIEFSQAVPATTTTGRYFGNVNSPFGSGNMQMTWSKNANSATGNLRIQFPFNQGTPSVHTFEILNFSAPWTSAVREGTTVHGPVTLTRPGTPSSTLSGELAVSVAEQGVVKLITTSLKDENNLSFQWAPPTTMDLDVTEFYEFIIVDDGWLYEPTPDFWDWLIVIDDKNDFDGDGQPNLIDPPSDVPPAAPTMQIIRTANGIQLVITGDIGKAYTLESAAALPAATWSNATPVTLTTSPQTIDLPAPTAPMFWRMRFP
jgi:hypothetical protein